MSFLGIDMSLNSPSFCVFSELENLYTCYAFSCSKKPLQEKKEKNLLIYYDSRCLKDQNDKFIKFRMIIEKLEEIYKKHPEIRKQGIEDYSFNSVSSSLSTIYELGGIIRYWFFCKGKTLEYFSPRTIKKLFFGNGNATKMDMYNAFLSKGFPQLFFKKEKKKESKKRKRSDNDEISIPSPYSDVVDSIAVVFCMK